jgi:hypothetical protein
MKNIMPISTYILNVKEHTGKFDHIKHQFADKPEFSISIIDLIENTSVATSFWDSIKYIIENKTDSADKYIIICEDDHEFTESYSKEILLNGIISADKLGAEILLGGVSWYRSALEVKENLFLVDKFSGFKLAVIYSRFFEKILDAQFSFLEDISFKISDLAAFKVVMYPFISIQKEFGDTDVVTVDHPANQLEKSFEKAAAQINTLISVKQFYGSLPTNNIDITEDQYKQLIIPVYIINLPERTERLMHIQKQFRGKIEFDTIVVEACKNTIGAIGLWDSIVKVINLAIENDDDVIIICEDDHQFTEAYSEQFLLKNILEAHNCGADVLSCGACDFGQIVPLTSERYWVNPLTGTQFIVVYKKLFREILKYNFREFDTADGVISKLSGNIMLLYPFISIQKDFGYSDVTREHNDYEGLVSIMFNQTEKRLKNIREAYINVNLLSK